MTASTNKQQLIRDNLAIRNCYCSDLLLVDDTDFNLLVLKKLCEKYGFIVQTATSGDLAI